MSYAFNHPSSTEQASSVVFQPGFGAHSHWNGRIPFVRFKVWQVFNQPNVTLRIQKLSAVEDRIQFAFHAVIIMMEVRVHHIGRSRVKIGISCSVALGDFKSCTLIGTF